MVDRMGAHVCARVGARPCVREETDCSHMKNDIAGKTLVIAEKPSVAQDIVRALTSSAGKFEKHDEYFENES